MQPTKSDRRWRWTAAAALAAFAATAHGESWVMDPYAKLLTEYDSNARLAADSDEHAAAVSAIGALSLSRRTEISEVAAELRADAVRYLSGDFEDRLNRRAALDWKQKGERSDLTVAAAYERDTILRTVETIIQPDDVALDPDADVDVALVAVDVRRDRFRLRPAYEYDWSERVRLGAALGYRRVDYGEAVPGLSEYTHTTASGFWAYRLSELDQLTTTLVIGHYEADDFDRSYDSRELRAALEHAFSETLEGGVEVGAHETEWDDGDDTGYLLRLYGSKRTGITRFSGRLGRSLAPSSSGDIVQTDELRLRMTRELGPRSRFWLVARLYQNESLRDENVNANRRYLSLQPTASWNITQAWAVEGGYRYRRQKRDVDADSADSHMVYVALRYAFPVALDE